MVLWFGGRESIFLFSHTDEFCGNPKVAREPGLACGIPETPRWVYDRTRSAREGSRDHRRVGKMKKVVKRRGVGVLVFAGEIFFWRYRVASFRPGLGAVGIGVDLENSRWVDRSRVGTSLG